MALKGGDKLQAMLIQVADKIAQGEVLRVGFLETATYPTGEKVAQVAFWNEYGTKTAPARPFFRNMIAAKKGAWGDDLHKVLKASGYDVKLSLERMGMRISEQLRQSIVDTDEPALSAITLMLRKMRQGQTDAPVTIGMVAEAARRVADGESTAGVNAKPLIYTNVMRSSVAYDIQGVE